MFKKTLDDRLSEWKKLREKVDSSDNPFADISQFWSEAPHIPYNHKVDRFNPNSWPTPWDIIVDNRYDDFTIGLMMGWTLKLTEKFSNSRIELRTMVDENRTKLYNLVYIDDVVVLNYDKWDAIKVQDIPESFLIENLVGIEKPR